MDKDGYWTFTEWKKYEVEKIIRSAMAASEEDRAEYLDVQISSAIAQALRHGRSGKGDHDPVTP